jgi:pyruvate dehydrogenase E2 component (dihydrolipoamide acetyltransferase)
VKVGQLICVIGGAASAPAPSPAAPTAAAAPANEQRSPKLQVIERSAPVQQPAAPASTPRPVAAAAAAPAPRPPGAPILASPTVRRLAREMGVDIQAVATSDPSGRVSAQDVMLHARGGTPALAAQAPTLPGGAMLEIDRDAWGVIAYEPMNAIRRITAERMAKNWVEIPHVTHFDKADITALEAARLKHAKAIEAQGGKLTVTCFLIKVICEALKRFPRFNASIDPANERLILKRYCHVGVAADTPNGLLVPVIRDADRKSMLQLAQELPALAARARDRKLAPEDMQGGTFTISNLGGIGGQGFTPIINAPEVAILGVSRSSLEPVHMNGQFVPRLMLPLSLSYDHRVIDGADAARFARWVCEALEQPWSLFIEA